MAGMFRMLESTFIVFTAFLCTIAIGVPILVFVMWVWF